MRTDDLVDSSGQIIGFTVSAFETDRRGVCRIVQSIPSARITRKPNRFSRPKEEVFCEFEINGEQFVAKGPFGNNHFFWIGPEPVRYLSQTQKVRDAFRAKEASRLFRLLGVLVGAFLCTVGILLLSIELSASSILPAFGGMILGGYLFYFGVTGKPFVWSRRSEN